MSQSEYDSLIARELEILRRSSQPSIWLGTSAFQSESDWETDQSETESSYTSSIDDSPRPTYSGRQNKRQPGSYGASWCFQPFPLSVIEERAIVKRRQWRPLSDTVFGDYYVAPQRYDIKWIQRIYWMSREVRSVVRTITPRPDKCFIKELIRIRNLIYSMSPGNGKRSSLQCKLLSDVYYCLRQCSRLQDDE